MTMFFYPEQTICSEDIEDLPEEISMCWGNILVLCSNMGLLRECQRVVNEERW